MQLKDIKAAYRVTVKGIVRDGNRILFVRERGDTWDLPGGGLEHGESLHKALRREFREELQVKIDIVDAPPIIIPTWNTKFDDPVLIIAYEVRLLSDLQTTPNVQELKFHNLIEAKAAPLDSTLIDKLPALF